MNNYIKDYLDSFDTDLLDAHEHQLYNSLLSNGFNKRIALIELVKQVNELSYYLEEIKTIIQENEKDNDTKA